VRSGGSKWRAPIVVLVFALGAAGIAGCTSDAPEDPADASEQTTGERSTEPTVSLRTFTSDLGPALADDKGFTLYGYDDDTDGVSNCIANCAVIFPPLPASSLDAGDGVSPDLVGSMTRTDELGTQLTYAGRPIYRFSGDNLPGDTLGAGSGGRWWLVSPTGERLTG